MTALFRHVSRMEATQTRSAKAVRVTGRFKSVTIRSLPRQTPPYAPLEEVLKTGEQVRTLENIDGTMVGFRMPEIIGNVAPPAFHLHFISADARVGGHVLDFEIAAGRIELDDTPAFHILLPSLAR